MPFLLLQRQDPFPQKLPAPLLQFADGFPAPGRDKSLRTVKIGVQPAQGPAMNQAEGLSFPGLRRAISFSRSFCLSSQILPPRRMVPVSTARTRGLEKAASKGIFFRYSAARSASRRPRGFRGDIRLPLDLSFSVPLRLPVSDKIQLHLERLKVRRIFSLITGLSLTASINTAIRTTAPVTMVSQ